MPFATAGVDTTAPPRRGVDHSGAHFRGVPEQPVVPVRAERVKLVVARTDECHTARDRGSGNDRVPCFRRPDFVQLTDISETDCRLGGVVTRVSRVVADHRPVTMPSEWQHHRDGDQPECTHSTAQAVDGQRAPSRHPPTTKPALGLAKLQARYGFGASPIDELTMMPLAKRRRSCPGLLPERLPSGHVRISTARR